MNNIQEEKELYKNQIDGWIKVLGLPQHQPSNDEIENILCFSRQELTNRPSVQLSEDACLLAQYALFLQQKNNECQTFLKWSHQVINRLLGDDRPQLHKWVHAVELRLERIQYLARRIEIVGQSIANLVRNRYNERNF